MIGPFKSWIAGYTTVAGRLAAQIARKSNIPQLRHHHLQSLGAVLMSLKDTSLDQRYHALAKKVLGNAGSIPYVEVVEKAQKAQRFELILLHKWGVLDHLHAILEHDEREFGPWAEALNARLLARVKDELPEGLREAEQVLSFMQSQTGSAVQPLM